MFGKLSVHFANANLPPNPLGPQGSLAVRELLQKPATQLNLMDATQAIQDTAEDSDDMDSQTADDSNSPNVLDTLGSEEKAEYIISNMEYWPMCTCWASCTFSHLKTVSDVLYQMDKYPLDFDYWCYNICKARHITEWLNIHSGQITENIAEYIRDRVSKAGAAELLAGTHKNPAAYLTRALYFSPYVMKYGYKPFKISKDPDFVHDVMAQLKRPEIIEILRIFKGDHADKLVSIFCRETVEETHNLLCDQDSGIHSESEMVYIACLYYKFVETYSDGIPPDMYKRWIEYMSWKPYATRDTPKCVKNASRQILEKDRKDLYIFIWSNRALLDEFIECMEKRRMDAKGRKLKLFFLIYHNATCTAHKMASAHNRGASGFNFST